MKIRLYILLACVLLSHRVMAVYYSINIDYKTAAAMMAAYNAEAAVELMGDESVREMLKHYKNAEIATAGIFLTKYMDYKHLRDAGKFSDAQENAYYKRIYRLVSQNIIPKTWDVAKLMIKYPDRAPYWVPFLIKTCEDTKGLCMQFESVVTNNKLSFGSIPFLTVNQDVKEIFDMSKLGGVDWETTFDNLSTMADSITVDDLKMDMEDIAAMGAALASAGGVNERFFQNSRVGRLFNGAPQTIYSLYTTAGQFMDNISRATAEGDILGLLGTNDSIALIHLFNVGEYDIDQFISDYEANANNSYYTQRYYIYSQDSGSETLCRYEPPTDDNSVIHGSEWTRFDTTDPNFYPNASQREQALSNSENYAGWSRSRVNQMNQSNDGNQYNISYYQHAYIISRNGNQRQKSYAYSIMVTKSWNHKEEVYEDVYDSYSMDLNAFLSTMNAKLDYYNKLHEDDGSGIRYYLGMDSKKYYQATDAAHIKGVSSVIYTVHCTDGQKLGEGSTSWKENGNQGKSLSEASKRFAMETSLSDDDDPVGELDEKLRDMQKVIDDLESQISVLETEKNNISTQLRDLGYDAELMAKFRELESQIDTLEKQLKTAKDEYKQIEEIRDEALNDYADVEDEKTRIPAIMHDVQAAYHITWDGEGYWSGYEYIRKGKMSGMESIVTFRAKLSLARKPSYFLGIRYHRAILQIDWELTTEYSYSDVVDMMELDMDITDEERAQIVNQRLSELAQDYPSCTVEADYRKGKQIDAEEEDGMPHLLWASDRLAIARDIESRLVSIYAKLAMLERYIMTSRSLKSMVLNTILNGIDHSKRRSIGIEALNRWKESAGQAMLPRNRREEGEYAED